MAVLNAPIGLYLKRPQLISMNIHTLSVITSPSAKACVFRRKPSRFTTTTNRGSRHISNTNYRRNKKLTKETTRTNTGRRDMKRRRPSRPPRSITLTSWRRISPPTTQVHLAGSEGDHQLQTVFKIVLTLLTLLFLTVGMTFTFALINKTPSLLPADDITVQGFITYSDESEYRDQVNKKIWSST